MSEYELAEYMDDRLTYVRRFIGGTPRSPIEWLSMGRKNGFTPYWLPNALGDEICRRFLPPEILDNSLQPVNKMKLAQIRKGLARSRSSAVWRSIEQHGRPVFSEWWKSKPEIRSSKETLAEAIREEVTTHADLPRGARGVEQASLQTIKSHIRRWIIEAVGQKRFQAWLQDPSCSSVAELAETIRQEISLRARDGRHVPSAAIIQRQIVQWWAEAKPKGS